MIINCWFDEVEQKEKVTDIRWTDSDGKLHHENGPAVVRADGNKEWYTNGELCTEKILKQKKLQPQPYTWMVPNYVAWWKRHLGATHDS